MAVEVREFSEGELYEFQNVQARVYSNVALAREDVRPALPDERCYGVVADGQVASVAGAWIMDVHRGPAVLACGGIQGVATLPEQRRGGHASRLMRECLRRMKDDLGLQIASLYPYRDTYYRRFGYEFCGWRWQLRVPTARLPKVEPRLDARVVGVDELDSLEPCYRGMIRRLSGNPVRTPERWKVRMGRKPPVVYAFGDPVEAYLWVAIEGFWNETRVGEFGWCTPRGYESGLALLTSMCANQTALVWSEPPNSPYLARFVDQGVEANVHRPTMYRALDVPAALERLQPEQSGRFTLEVIDDELPENRGPWHVEFGPGGVKTSPCESAEIRLDIRPFSQALMGAPSLAELAEFGLVEGPPEAIAQASRLLTPLPVVCMDFF